VSQRLLLSLPTATSSPAAARAEVGGYLDEHGWDSLSPVARVLVSELVTNAVVHGTPPIELCLSRRNGAFRIEVTDAEGERPVVSHLKDSSRPGGLGLHLIGDLAAGWGVDPHGRGKTVWAELAIPDDV
jgi:anti-sigma regulatory factor (Ser/Thr protein kinase)